MDEIIQEDLDVETALKEMEVEINEILAAHKGERRKEQRVSLLEKTELLCWTWMEPFILVNTF